MIQEEEYEEGQKKVSKMGCYKPGLGSDCILKFYVFSSLSITLVLSASAYKPTLFLILVLFSSLKLSSLE